MSETHIKSQPKMPKPTPNSLKASTFIQSIRSSFSLRRRLGCSSSSSTSIEMAANIRTRTQSNNTTNVTGNNNNKSSKKNANFMMQKQRKVVVAVAKHGRRHRQQQLVDLEDVPAMVTSPDSPPTSSCDSSPDSFTDKNHSFRDVRNLVAEDTRDTFTENQKWSREDTSRVTTVALGCDSLRVPRVRTKGLQTGLSRHRAPYSSPDELAQILLRQTNILLGRYNSPDQFRDWRLDTDDMTYEQLLALGDKIGYVNTGLKDSEILRYVKKIKFLRKTSLELAEETDKNCSICQEEYEMKDKLGLLMCKHTFHRDCIKQWLRHKKICPVCKSEVVSWL